MPTSIKRLYEANSNTTNGDVPKSLANTAKQLQSLLKEGKVKPEEISIREMFDVFCNPEGKLDMATASSARIAEAITSTGFPTVTKALLHPKVIEAYELAMGDISTLVTELPVSRPEEKIAGFNAPEGLEKVGEGMPYEESVLTEKYVMLKSSKFGRIISLTREMILFDQTGQILQRARQIGEMAGYHRAQYILEKATSVACTATGESANNSLFWDGTARTMFANTHTFDSSSYANDNLITTALSTDGISEAMYKLKKMKNQQGQYVNLGTPITLLIPPELEKTARKLLESEGDPDTADRSTNIHRGSFRILSHPLLSDTDTNDWFFGNFARQTYWGWIWPIETSEQTSTSEKAFENDIVSRYKVSYYGGCNTFDYKYVLKSEVA
jgi:hypothetical protein